MKKFNIILIASLTLIFAVATGCSKKEDSPYSREQIIGKWNHKSYWETDDAGNGRWVDYLESEHYYYQFNADGTFFTYRVHDERDSSWELTGRSIYCKTTAIDSNKLKKYVFEIISLSTNELIINAIIDNGRINKFKLIKEY